ncbi:MAG: alpha-L-fucosidase [Chitinophagaceae bacterium]|nr:alpha-L-fucosidase [Chitinophagaceae bacterium]
MMLLCCNHLRAQYNNTIPVTAEDTQESILFKAAHVVPTSNQYAALKNEFIAFIHFGPNTFTRMEWGSGKEDPRIFDLKELHTDQWCEAMKAAGMKMVIITVKHHDGFVLWQSRYTAHGIMSTGFQNGKGDILRELSNSCQKYGLKLGIYLSPADLFQIESPTGLYGNLSKYSKRTIPREVPGRPFSNPTKFEFEADDYNEYFLNQLFELLTEYGPIHEVWFDGAHPKRKGGQQYNYQAWKKLIRTLAPEAVIFGREDIRWCGNEEGRTRNTEWNIIPYPEDPNKMNNFPDLTDESLGSRDNLYKGKFLHYQQAETNTSIREGWFYRDDQYQKVRNADDVFDIYERAVGGNSTFLLNIPPNREGKFSPEDVSVLNETGKRIRETYDVNLFANAGGPIDVLDNSEVTYAVIQHPGEIVITTPAPVTINRLVIQEAIATNGERVEQHAVDAWIDNNWKEIATATNIGYKRILRFPEVRAGKFRVRILAARYAPAISNITAHYYKTRPPQLQITRDKNGMVTIEPLRNAFGWNPHGQNAAKNLNAGAEIYYTTNGSAPDKAGRRYTAPFMLEKGEVKAVSKLKAQTGSIASRQFGIPSGKWKLLGADSEQGRNKATLAFDANAATYWQSDSTGASHFIAIDAGSAITIKAFVYTPQTRNGNGMMEKGVLKVSDDGVNWKTAAEFTFGNLVNDPTPRRFNLPAAVTTKYIRIESTQIAGGDSRLSIAELELL